MKNAHHTRCLSVLVLLLFAGQGRICAQPEVMLHSAPPALPGVLLKEISCVSNFTAVVEFKAGSTNADAKVETRHGTLAVHNGAIRFELDSRGAGRRPPAAPYVLLLPSRHIRYLVLEAIDGYAETFQEDWSTMSVERTETSPGKKNGKTTICFRCRAGQDANASQACMVWTLPDQSAPPTQIEWETNGVTTRLTLKKIRPLANFSSGDFQLPTDLKRYASEDELMAELTTRLVLNQPRPSFGQLPPGGPPGGMPPSRGGGGSPQ